MQPRYQYYAQRFKGLQKSCISLPLRYKPDQTSDLSIRKLNTQLSIALLVEAPEQVRFVVVAIRDAKSDRRRLYSEQPSNSKRCSEAAKGLMGCTKSRCPKRTNPK